MCSTLHLLDIDGVLANDGHRIDHARNKRWSQYFDPQLVAQDTLWPQGKALVEDLQRTFPQDAIGYLTGRSEELRVVTRDWLDANGFPQGDLYMRPPYAATKGTKRARLADFKVEIISLLRSSGPVVLYDDDPEVVEAVWAAFGPDAARHCTWHIKEKFLVKAASA